MKSIIKERREAGAVCSVCNSPDYTIHPPYEGARKPNIQCNSCKRWWQYGYTGGIYTKFSKVGDYTFEIKEKI